MEGKILECKNTKKPGELKMAIQLHNLEGQCSDTCDKTLHLEVYCCLFTLQHTYQCRDANCYVVDCHRMKLVFSHTKTCQLKTYGRCRVCIQLLALKCNHAMNCHETKCPLQPTCLNLKNFIWRSHYLSLKYHAVTIETIDITETIKQTSPGSSNPSSQPSVDNKLLTSPHVPQPAICMKPSACSPVGTMKASLSNCKQLQVKLGHTWWKEQGYKVILSEWDPNLK